METHKDAAGSLDADLDRLATLGDPLRRRMYRYVAERPTPQSREQVADGLGVPRHVAKFHLDKLAAEGLLDVEYRRPPGRTGPGAGRPTKLYSRADRALSVHLPARNYDLAGSIMAEAIDVADRTGAPIRQALRDTARHVGHRLGSVTHGKRLSRSARAQLRVVAEVLARYGFEPRIRDTTLVLANCPFHDVARGYPDVVCGMNAELIAGVVDALEASEIRPCLEPAEDRCCVTVHAS